MKFKKDLWVRVIVHEVLNMKYSSVVPSQDLQDESDLGALDFEVAVSAVSNSKSEKRKSRKVHDWKVCCHQWPHCCCKKNRIKEPTSQ